MHVRSRTTDLTAGEQRLECSCGHDSGWAKASGFLLAEQHRQQVIEEALGLHFSLSDEERRSAEVPEPIGAASVPARTIPGEESAVGTGAPEAKAAESSHSEAEISAGADTTSEIDDRIGLRILLRSKIRKPEEQLTFPLGAVPRVGTSGTISAVRSDGQVEVWFDDPAVSAVLSEIMYESSGQRFSQSQRHALACAYQDGIVNVKRLRARDHMQAVNANRVLYVLQRMGFLRRTDGEEAWGQAKYELTDKGRTVAETVVGLPEVLGENAKNSDKLR